MVLGSAVLALIFENIWWSMGKIDRKKKEYRDVIDHEAEIID